MDAAGGRGRNALWLAEEGFDVVLADVSPVALDLAQAMAQERGLSLESIEHDLEKSGWPAATYDGIVVVHFLDRARVREVATALRPGGWFAFIHPTARNLERHPAPSARWLLDDDEGPSLLAETGLDVESLETSWGASGRHEFRVFARRRPA